MNKDIHRKVKSIFSFFFFVTINIILINKAFHSLAVLKERLNKGSGKYYNWKLGKIYYNKQGSGTPLLLIHDLSVYSSAYEWSKLTRKLSESHTVYTLDLLGCGRSDKPAITYTSYLYVQLITDFINNIIGIKTDVIVSNNSTSILLMALQDNTNLFHKIICINPSNTKKKQSLSLSKAKAFKCILGLPIIGTFIYNITTNKYFLKNEFNNKYFYNTKKYSDKMLNTYYEAAHLGNENSKFLYASIVGNYTYSNISHVLEQINQKIIIIGSSELHNTNDIIKNYCSINPYIEYEIIEKSKMLPHLEIPDSIIEIIDKYI